MKQLFAFAALSAFALVTMTGCWGDADHKDSETSTSYLYQFRANCSGDNVADGHSNQILLTKASGSSAAVSVNDFYVDLGWGGTYPVGCESGASWSGTPRARASTDVYGLYWWVVGTTERSSIGHGVIYWNSLDLDGDQYAEGDASFQF